MKFIFQNGGVNIFATDLLPDQNILSSGNCCGTCKSITRVIENRKE
jgi:hypothetical protein